MWRCVSEQKGDSIFNFHKFLVFVDVLLIGIDKEARWHLLSPLFVRFCYGLFKLKTMCKLYDLFVWQRRLKAFFHTMTFDCQIKKSSFETNDHELWRVVNV